MKKLLLSVIVALTVNAAQAQYKTRSDYAQKDTIRTQVRMASIEAAVERYDTATASRKRLAAEILAVPTQSRWLDMFVYPIVILLQSAAPTDAQIKALVVTLWPRIAEINVQPLNNN